MRVRIAFLLTLAAPAAGAQPRPDTATYASEALRALVDAAARDNRVPAGLASYRADVESEFAIALRKEDGVEAVVAVEQIASALRWTRAGHYDLHVVGYRARQAVPTASMLEVMRSGWVAPVLYGDRLLPPRPPADSVRGRPRRTRARPTTAVHPFATDRARHYRFTGGDTVVTLRTAAAPGAAPRAIPIVRVHVEPRGEPPPNVVLFLGDIDVDAERHVVVRMRGQYLAREDGEPARRGIGVRLARAAMRAYAFIEYETAEREGRFWLPTFQRIEFQIASPALGESRAVLRVVSRLREVVVNDSALATLAAASQRDTVARQARWWRLTRAPSDTLDRFDAWRDALGAATGTLHADDFDDVAPDAWRRTGRPRVEFHAARVSDLVRFDRVEGLYTGAGVRVRFRDAAPGLTLRAAGGWAWSERAARGRFELERETADSAGRWTVGVRAARSLDITNDFRSPLDSGSSLGAVFGSVDPYDYVDRRLATLFVRRAFGARAGSFRVEVGAASDRGAATHVRQGLIAAPSPFRPNRGVDAGGYLRSAVTAELHPDVSAAFVRPGVGARLFYERGDAGLTFQRVEARVVARTDLPARWPGALRGSTLTATARGEAGALLGAGRPPQQLFELGGGESLQGYDYKAFAGDRAGRARVALVYGSPWWRAPLRLGTFAVPGLSPGLSLGVEAGWTTASSDAALRSIERLGPADSEGTPSRPSDGMRATLDAGLRFFGGALFVGGARPLDGHTDRPSGWRGVVRVGASM